tara:strand:+ start:436 stop:669 length:234 start_codon:yes stop_codon:yes gene_type:complete
MKDDYNGYIDIAARVLGERDDWMDFKKIMLRTLPSKMRKKFSTRDPVTKKQSLNHFEESMIESYYQKTGIRLILDKK